MADDAAERLPTPRIVLTDAPATRVTDSRCPRCGAGKERRVLSSGFGEPHDLCGQCGYDFPERTLSWT